MIDNINIQNSAQDIFNLVDKIGTIYKETPEKSSRDIGKYVDSVVSGQKNIKEIAIPLTKSLLLSIYLVIERIRSASNNSITYLQNNGEQAAETVLTTHVQISEIIVQNTSLACSKIEQDYCDLLYKLTKSRKESKKKFNESISGILDDIRQHTAEISQQIMVKANDRCRYLKREIVKKSLYLGRSSDSICKQINALAKQISIELLGDRTGKKLYNKVFLGKKFSSRRNTIEGIFGITMNGLYSDDVSVIIEKLAESARKTSTEIRNLSKKILTLIVSIAEDMSQSIVDISSELDEYVADLTTNDVNYISTSNVVNNQETSPIYSVMNTTLQTIVNDAIAGKNTYLNNIAQIIIDNSDQDKSVSALVQKFYINPEGTGEYMASKMSNNIAIILYNIVNNYQITSKNTIVTIDAYLNERNIQVQKIFAIINNDINDIIIQVASTICHLNSDFSPYVWSDFSTILSEDSTSSTSITPPIPPNIIISSDSTSINPTPIIPPIYIDSTSSTSINPIIPPIYIDSTSSTSTNPINPNDNPDSPTSTNPINPNDNPDSSTSTSPINPNDNPDSSTSTNPINSTDNSTSSTSTNPINSTDNSTSSTSTNPTSSEDSSEDPSDDDSETSSTSTSNSSTSTSSVEAVSTPAGQLIVKKINAGHLGWKGTPPKVPTGVEALMHDGDQQIFNPYGHHIGKWTVFSFRPKDTYSETESEPYPQIAITPSSFMALQTCQKMLNYIPYIVVKEYFFKNTASTMMNFIQKILKGISSKSSSDKSTSTGGETAENNDMANVSASRYTQLKTEGEELLKEIKQKFTNVSLKKQVIDIPYVLYCCLRKKVWGNTYVFPYIVDSSTIINEASNKTEWEKDGGLFDVFKSVIQGGADLVTKGALFLAGSNGATANLFPAPVWNNTDGSKMSFKFDLMLINDNVVKSRNNYICVNTIIHNNRKIQKSILMFPGALYELWLPTGQRHLMCTGEFKLYPLGVNRHVPKWFFDGNSGTQGANFKIGSVRGLAEKGFDSGNSSDGGITSMPTPHDEETEVIPDGYRLEISFQSCLENNMNVSVFQYYIKMTKYADYASKQLGGTSTGADSADSNPFSSTYSATETSKDINNTINNSWVRAIKELTTNNDVEAFDDATYNKKIGTLKSYLGNMAPDAESAVLAIRKSQRVIRESNDFLKKLYNAENNNLWFKDYSQDEYYTTLTADARQELQKRYRDKFKSLRNIDNHISIKQGLLDDINIELSRKVDFNTRSVDIARRVSLMKSINQMQQQRDIISDELLQIDTDLVMQALDQTDHIITVKRSNLTSQTFQQVWNEKIMNSYEKDKIQYMTSAEKTRYFEDKIRELKKYDTYGILNTEDWFFRVVVLDYIVSEMQNLISLFKSCTYSDFETVYKIVRKLDLLNLDITQIKDTTQAFDINNTNLFYLSDEDIKNFTKIDSLLNGNTLYQLFNGQVSITYSKVETPEVVATSTTENKALVVEQNNEKDIYDRRLIRDEIVVRVWGSEAELTKAAYALVNDSEDEIIIDLENGQVKTFIDLKGLKDRIIEMKLKGDTSDELRQLLGSFTNKVASVKEALVIQKMNEMYNIASETIKKKDGSVNAKTMS